MAGKAKRNGALTNITAVYCKQNGQLVKILKGVQKINGALVTIYQALQNIIVTCTASKSTVGEQAGFGGDFMLKAEKYNLHLDVSYATTAIVESGSCKMVLFPEAIEVTWDWATASIDRTVTSTSEGTHYIYFYVTSVTGTNTEEESGTDEEGNPIYVSVNPQITAYMTATFSGE